tara:strand:+ start:981 stop:1322 length:342 start_codon:yes stop_codon:yes gene_type:complete
MIPVNIIFKIIENNPEKEMIIIKSCRQNSPKSIDNCKKVAISYSKLDFSDLYNFEESIRTLLSKRCLADLCEEPVLKENESQAEIESMDINSLLDKVIAIPFGFENDLKEIEL